MFSFITQILLIGLNLENSYYIYQKDKDHKSSPLSRIGANVTLGSRQLELKADGDCYMFDSDERAVRPVGIHRDPEQNHFCMLREAYGQVSHMEHNLGLGKRNFIISQSQISSPANPSRAGLVQGGPFDRREGIPMVVYEGFWGASLTYAFGIAMNEELKESYPLIRTTINGAIMDGTLIIAENFLGMGVIKPLGDSALWYSEANLHKPPVRRSESKSLYRNTYADFLIGISIDITVINSYLRNYNLVGEYLLNSHGIKDRLEYTDWRNIQANINNKSLRQEYYDFAYAENETAARWGYGDFLCRDYFFVNIYRQDADLGLNLSLLWNINDHSARGEFGYRYLNNQKDLGKGWILGLLATVYHGAQWTEYGEAKKRNGDKTYRLSLEYPL